MAKSRSIPIAWMTDPDYMELESDVQVILLMLILTADDEGRGQAHTGMLSRHFNKPARCIEDALATLASLELVACYVVGRHRYYQLLRWGDWQTLSKPTPSRFPAPPTQPVSPCAPSPRGFLETPGESVPEGEKEPAFLNVLPYPHVSRGPAHSHRFPLWSQRHRQLSLRLHGRSPSPPSSKWPAFCTSR